MPLYNVEHSFPLTLQQKTDLAERITKLHSHAFTAPSMFVQVRFQPQDVTAQNDFTAGVLRTESINRIIGYVRTSSARTKEHFDRIAQKIEHAWYVVLGEAKDEDDEEDTKEQKSGKKESSVEKKAKELLLVAIVPGISGREKGFTLPVAGEEEAWIKQHREKFEHEADMGDESFKQMLLEIEKRDDLKGWRGPKPYGQDEKKEKKEEASNANTSSNKQPEEKAQPQAGGEQKEVTTNTKAPGS